MRNRRHIRSKGYNNTWKSEDHTCINTDEKQCMRIWKREWVERGMTPPCLIIIRVHTEKGRLYFFSTETSERFRILAAMILELESFPGWFHVFTMNIDTWTIDGFKRTYHSIYHKKSAFNIFLFCFRVKVNLRLHKQAHVVAGFSTHKQGGKTTFKKGERCMFQTSESETIFEVWTKCQLLAKNDHGLKNIPFLAPEIEEITQ